jgi:hypothetical protein
MQRANPFLFQQWEGQAPTILPQRGDLVSSEGSYLAAQEQDYLSGGSTGGTAKPIDDYTWYYVGAGAAAVVGLALLYRSHKKGGRR